MHEQIRILSPRTLAAALTLCLTTGGARAGIAGLTLYGEHRIATGTATADGIELGGLSGIDYVAATGRYVAISDDRSQLGDARFYDVQIDFDRNGFNGIAFSNATPMRDSDGLPFAPGVVDPESIRYDANSNSLYWTSEGDTTNLVNPFVREMGLDGAYVRGLQVPAHYNPTADGNGGIRNNLAFESLTLTTDGQSAWVATENALVQDGPAASLTQTSPARILELDLATGNAGAEYIYETDAVTDEPVPPGAFATNGLVEILALNATQFIAVERAFSVGAGNNIRLYLADLTGATDVSALSDGIVGETVTPIKKTLLHDLGADFGLSLDNIEGITFGPDIDGRRSLLLVSDNNFSGGQFTQFLAFGINAVPVPSTVALLALMLPALGLRGFRAA